MSPKRCGSALALLMLVATGCQKQFDAPLKLASGKEIPTSVLNEGLHRYTEYCATCHGATGNGRGPSSTHMRPHPRNFQLGLFKFGGVAAGQLPTDAALMRTLRRGLNGTPMLAWDLPDAQRRAIIQFIKTLSPRWKQETPGKPIAVSKDPWVGHAAQAVAHGEEVYHLSTIGHAGCNNCHRSYVTHQALSALYQKATGRPLTRFSKTMYQSHPRDSDYPLTFDSKGDPSVMQKVTPPDFLFDKTKTVFEVGTRVAGKRYTAADQREDLYRVIASGVGGAAMPSWKGALSEKNLWALAYYVQSLVQMRDTPEARKLEEALRTQGK